MDRELVITVHGVNPDRTWQDRVHAVLEPHFRCAKIEYEEYDTWRGPLRAVINLWMLTFSLVAAATAITCFLFSLWLAGAAVFVIGVGLLAAGLAMARQMRWHVLKKKYRPRLEELCPAHYPAAHLIAHSFGTWLSGTALRRWSTVRFKYLVLVGCVLPCRFPWRRIVKERRDAYRSVRNEVGEGDWVVWAVNLVHPIVPEMGGAGLIGFFGSWFHRSFSPKGLCRRCTVERAEQHNIHLREYAHSETFLSDRHAAELWLPYLWDIEPLEFQAFVDCCFVLTEFFEAGAAHALWQRRRHEARFAAEELVETNWSWTRRGLLDDLCSELSRLRFRRKYNELSGAERAQVKRLARRALRVICVAVVDAVREKALSPSSRRDATALALHPELAFHKALLAVCR